MKVMVAAVMTVLVLLPQFLFAGTPIERDAVINSKLRGETQALEEMVRLVRANGYRCDSISAARPMMFSRGFVLVCNGFAYEFEIEDKGGRWRVTVK